MTEYRTLLSNFIKKSATVGLLRNDGTVDTTNYVSTSNTGGLIKNDGTIDGTSYATLDQVYPVGSIYMSINSTDPSTLFGGSWTRLKDTFLLASGDTYANGSTGGEATHTLTTDEMPSHTHIQNSHNHTQNAHHHDTNTNWSSGSGSESAYVTTANRTRTTRNTKDTTATNKAATATNQNTGGGQAHNNMPPYLAVYMWKRTS